MPKGHKNSINTSKSEKIHLQDELQQSSLLSTSSLSTSSDNTKSEDSYLKQFGASTEEEEINIFDLLQQFDTESSEDEESEYEQISFVPEADFFEFFGEVPNVEDVSEDTEIAPQPIEVPIVLVNKTIIQEDEGKFVNPLTGLELDESADSASRKSIEQKISSEEHEEETEITFKGSEHTTSDELLSVSVASEEGKETRDDSIDDTLAAFFELEREPCVVKEEIDWEALAQAEEAKACREHTLTFLDELVNKVVKYAEHLSPEKILQKHLDKRKLIAELLKMLSNVQNANNISAFLNRQIVRYFRRKKSFRCLLEDSPSTLLQEKQKLEKAKEHLDQALAKEKKLEQVSKELQAELKEQCKSLKQQIESHIELFENQVKKHLYRERFSRLKTEINRSLMMMSKHRQEISEVRFSLLLHQHTEATLRDQINKINDLGNGLNMQNFTTFEAENQTLGKKIEERNADLAKLHRRCHNNIHILAHYKESQLRFSNTIKAQKAMWDDVTSQERFWRERLFSLKLQRNYIHNKIKKLRIQGGLLDKPYLMRDYDRTIKIIAAKKETVEYLRRTMLSTQKKIDQIIAHVNQKKISYI